VAQPVGTTAPRRDKNLRDISKESFFSSTVTNRPKRLGVSQRPVCTRVEEIASDEVDLYLESLESGKNILL
jgi:hypothetical protein